MMYAAKMAGAHPFYTFYDSEAESIPRPEVVFLRTEGGLTISLVLTDERPDPSEWELEIFNFLVEFQEEIPAALAKEITDEIFARCAVVGGIRRFIWIYELDTEKLAELHRLYGTSEDFELTSIIERAIPLDELESQIAQEGAFGSGYDLHTVDCSLASQEFHRRMLSIGVYPTVCFDGDDPHPQMRMMYGDECFESLSDDDWERFDFDDPRPQGKRVAGFGSHENAEGPMRCRSGGSSAEVPPPTTHTPPLS